MACSTGEACGLTDTRSSARSSLNQSAVIRLTIDALEAWWPPTFTPERFSRTRLAWCTIAAESQSTRRSMALSVSRSGAADGGEGLVVVGEPLKGGDSLIPQRYDQRERQLAGCSARAPARGPRALPRDPVVVDLETPELDLAQVPDRQP